MTDNAQTSAPWYPSLPWDERWSLIKEALHAQGLSLTRLQKDYSVSGVATVKDKRYPAAQKAIGDALGVVPAALFPERYDIQWDDHYQAEAVKALPGLRGVNTAAQGRANRLEALHATYRNIPVDLEDLPADMMDRAKWVKEKVKERGFNLSEVAAHGVGSDSRSTRRCGS